MIDTNSRIPDADMSLDFSVYTSMERLNDLTSSIEASDKTSEQLKHEVSIHNRLRHKNIVQLVTDITLWNLHVLVFEFCDFGSLSSQHVLNISPKRFYLVSLYATLTRALFLGTGVDISPYQFFFISELIEGLLYIHDQGVAHLDIKPDNVQSVRKLTRDYTF